MALYSRWFSKEGCVVTSVRYRHFFHSGIGSLNIDFKKYIRVTSATLSLQIGGIFFTVVEDREPDSHSAVHS